ncbi:fibroblast growth factor receptor 2-like [Chanos chanos]|uniref:Fibroblast growth factor receptor 2-like n=1 Tax=Chanos chanos TaxID=29144 RepID=A0A6J2WV38_CHACN|nr:fibroblast growth factor receptor 2-like [Chanos chanos]
MAQSGTYATDSPHPTAGPSILNEIHYVLISVSALTVLMIITLSFVWLRKYRSLTRTIDRLQSDNRAAHPLPPDPEDFSPCVTETGSRFNKADLSLQQLIKAGREGTIYKAKMIKGTCKGHSVFICKVAKRSVSLKRMDREISIMRKLGSHKNILQLLDWDICEAPYTLIMEFVAYGTLRSYLQVNQDSLSMNSDLQHLFTISAYHIAHAMDHLRSKMVVHCDLALRNIMVNRFPSEVKVAEFGLARDLTRMRSRRSSRNKDYKERVPLRWYPPEYFRNDHYGFKGDVWAFGIVMWEMQTFGLLPYPDLDSTEKVVQQVCAGHRNAEPDGCRPEIWQMMTDCWQEPYSMRPSFKDIVRVFENILENDMDYVDVDNSRLLAKLEAEN